VKVQFLYLDYRPCSCFRAPFRIIHHWYVQCFLCWCDCQYLPSFLLVYRQLIGQCLCFLHPLLYSLSAVPSSYFDWRILISNGCQIVLLRAYFIYNIIIILLLYHQYVSSTIHNHCSVSRHGVCAYSSQHACTLNLYFFVNLFHTNVIHEESIYNIYTYTQHTTTYMTPKR
jgi:hypothetical protein